MFILPFTVQDMLRHQYAITSTNGPVLSNHYKEIPNRMLYTRQQSAETARVI